MFCLDTALVLVHEAMPLEDYSTYLNEVLWPVRVLLCVGRSATLDPPCKKQECVFYWWKVQPFIFCFLFWLVSRIALPFQMHACDDLYIDCLLPQSLLIRCEERCSV